MKLHDDIAGVQLGGKREDSGMRGDRETGGYLTLYDRYHEAY